MHGICRYIQAFMCIAIVCFPPSLWLYKFRNEPYPSNQTFRNENNLIVKVFLLRGFYGLQRKTRFGDMLLKFSWNNDFFWIRAKAMNEIRALTLWLGTIFEIMFSCFFEWDEISLYITRNKYCSNVLVL